MAPVQAHPRFFLQPAYLHAQRRLGHIQLFGGAGDVAGLGNTGKVLKLAKFSTPH